MKKINNIRDGFHLNSKHWQDWKKNLPVLPSDLTEIAIAMVLSDASMYKVSREALIKFEQGYQQLDFVQHLFEKFKGYCFMQKPGFRMHQTGPQNGQIKSAWFKTFSHSSFTKIWDLFYIDKVKTVRSGIIIENINALGLAYWIMSDGSLHRDGRSMILHTQSYTEQENLILSDELNKKFELHSTVTRHKTKYWVITIPSSDGNRLHELIKPFILVSFAYKIPRKI